MLVAGSPLLNFTTDKYIPEPYVPPNSVISTHRQPRFGRTNDFSTVLDGNSDEVQEYVVGIVLGAMIILIVAICWFFAIVCLKIVGQSRVGFLAGRLVRPAAIQSQDNEGKGGVEVVMAGDQTPDGENDVNEAVPVNGASNAADSKTEKKFVRTVWAVRGVFVLSGMCVIISGGLFYGKGVVSFKNSLDEVQAAANKAIDLTENVLQAGEDVEKDLEPSREVAASNEDKQICRLDSDLSSQIRNAYDALSSNVDEMKNMLDGSLEDFGHDLRSLVNLTEDVNESLDQADIFFYILIAISVIIIGIIVAMLVGAFFAWKGVFNCFTKCIQYTVIWPLFIFFLVLSWIFATLFLVVSMGGADFCFSPDQHVQALLNKNSGDFDGLIFGFIIYYVSGCTILPRGEEEIVAILSQLKLVLGFAHTLSELLGELPVEQIGIICGLSIYEASALKSLTDLAHDTTHALNRGVVGLKDVLSCGTFNPIYTTFVHKAFCVEGVSGLKYIFSTTLVISIFSMVMLMFRAALYPIKESAAQSVSESDNAMEVVEYNEESENDDKPVVY
ncbi:hypothetical protein ACHAXR_004030 [Thalassiosira sp. AJA248-18]